MTAASRPHERSSPAAAADAPPDSPVISPPPPVPITARLTTALRAVVAASPIPMAVIDVEGDCLLVNQPFAELAGVPPDALVGRPLTPPTRATVSQLRLDDGAPDQGAPDLRLVTLSGPPTPDRTGPNGPGGPTGSAGPVRNAAATVDADLLARALNTLPAMINLKDTNQRYLFVNDYQAACFGVAASDTIGLDVSEVTGPVYGEHLRAIDHDILRRGGPTGFFDERNADGDGRLRDWLVHKAPVRDANGAIEAIATLALDITERANREEALINARDRAEEEGRARGRFLATVGHELRSPLHAIVGFAEVLAAERHGPLGHDTYRDYVNDILTAGRHVLDVVNDIVDLAKLEAGRLVLDEEPEDLDRLVHDALRMTGLPAQRKGIATRRVTAPDLPPVVVDARRMRQVLVNLVTNALKYTPAGGHVTVSLERRNDGDVVLEVRDDGVGIASEDMTLAMTPFGRVRHDISNEQDGSGLGLPLVKALMEAHGGRFELLSEPGRGTRARCVLPAHRVRARP